MILFVLWADALERELLGAGFHVRRVEGRPVVTPADFWEAARVIEFKPETASAKWTHAGDVIFTPPGMAPAKGIPA